MTDRPILFSGPMVRAILREIEAPGTGKTQTRRVLKPQPPEKHDLVGIYAPGLTAVFNPSGRRHRGDPDSDIAIRLPYMLKDRLWVRETFALECCQEAGWYDPPHKDGRPIKITDCEHWGRYWDQPHYRATDPNPELDIGTDDPGVKWKPSLFMPRWASRITLTVTDVRVQRLRDITEADAIAEGAARLVMDDDGKFYESDAGDHRTGFAGLWDHLNDKRGFGWDRNPWVAAITFRPELRNIDATESLEVTT